MKQATRDRREQQQRILRFIRYRGERGMWLTVGEIRTALEAHWHVPFPENSVQAQLRNLRKPACGGHDIPGRYRSGSLYEYTWRAPKQKAAVQGSIFEARA